MTAVPDNWRAVVHVLAATGHPPADLAVTPATPLGEGGLELNSLELVRVLAELEEAFAVELDEEAVVALVGAAPAATAGDVAAIVHAAHRVVAT